MGTRRIHPTLRLALVAVCVIGAGWTCSAMRRPRQVGSMPWEQALELARQGNTAAAVAITTHTMHGLDALRQCGADGRALLQRIAQEANR